MLKLSEELKNIVKGEVFDDAGTLSKYSRDASLFEVVPKAVVFPRDTNDVKALVKFVADNKDARPELSLTPRSAGTDMSGGPLNESIILDLTKHFNGIKEIGEDGAGGGYAIAQPGVFYRDFEKATLAHGFLLPSYPASREICAMGGIVANNSGGEKTLKYGKTEDYVKELKIVFADGNEYVIKPLNKSELEEKTALKNFEGEVYREIYGIVNGNRELLTKAKPKVSKNSAGYCLWNVWNGEKFDLTKIIIGSQGTFGIITEITFRLVPVKKHSGMLAVFLNNLNALPEIVKTTLAFKPTSFESFDDHTLKLALKFFPGFLKLLGAKNLFSLAVKFLPEFFMVISGGIPKLVLLIEFEGGSEKEVHGPLFQLNEALKKFRVKTRIARNKDESEKYWAIRRESFNLLRHKVKNKKTAPFIDDVIVRPEFLPEFLPKINEIGKRYGLLYTIAGHVGDGNFHIIPLMKIEKEEEREKIQPVADEVYDLVLKFGGSITAEHNDGLIRSPYLEKMYGHEVMALFEKTKKIFDYKNIFNPGKKVHSSLDYAFRHIKKS